MLRTCLVELLDVDHSLTQDEAEQICLNIDQPVDNLIIRQLARLYYEQRGWRFDSESEHTVSFSRCDKGVRRFLTVTIENDEESTSPIRVTVIVA